MLSHTHFQWTSQSVWVSETELGIAPQLCTSAPTWECPAAATTHPGQSCPPSIMVPFTQKYSNKVGSNKYFNQVYPIERGIPEAAFLFLCIQRQEECGLCFSAGMQACTTPLRRGMFHWCFLISATCFTMFFLGHLEVSNQHILGPRTEARTFERVTHLSATAYYVKGINCHSLSWVLSAKLYFSVKQNHLSSNLGWDRWGRSNTVLRNSQLK